MRRILTGTVVCLLLAGGSATGARAAGRLPAFCDGSWRSPKPVPHSSGYRLNDVVAVGQKDVWIVGAAEDGPLALHWNGYTWRRTPVRGVRLHAKLEGVAAGPSREVWAVGRTPGDYLHSLCSFSPLEREWVEARSGSAGARGPLRPSTRCSGRG